MPRSRPTDQLALDEQVLEDDELLTALESWQNSKDEAAATRRVAKDAYAKASALLDRYPIEVGSAARIGRFRVTRVLIEGGHREFDVADRERVSIALVDED